MSVYVDPLFVTGLTRQWPYPRACHLFADGDKELHALAARIGLKRTWFQNRPGKLPHYDLTMRMRRRAISAGAIELTRQEAAAKMRTIKEIPIAI